MIYDHRPTVRTENYFVTETKICLVGVQFDRTMVNKETKTSPGPAKLFFDLINDISDQNMFHLLVLNLLGLQSRFHEIGTDNTDQLQIYDLVDGINSLQRIVD